MTGLLFRWVSCAWVMVGSTVCLGVDYLGEVKPLLQHKCYACHGALKQLSGLRLDTGASLIKGGDSGAAVAAGDPDSSLLVDVLTGEAGFRMPPESEGAPLTAKEIELIRQWIAAGAPIPKDEVPQSDPRHWWSYQPIQRPPVPETADDGWCRNEIDHFVAARRAEAGLPHVAEASKSLWLRRVYLDLIGLPPTRDELAQFLCDDSPRAYERVVDDLLSRPQYGERWGRHWMDVWRYSDWYGSRGINEIRYSQRHIWRWRDWIVDSLNEDKGYDQMIREMLAADELGGGDPSNLQATGYLGRNWYKFDRNVWMFETVERTGEAFLGLTLRCCRCHDHKFDPVTQEEYYRFRACFEPHDVRTDPVSAFTETQKDAKLGQVLNEGIALVFDKNPEASTYRLERGDSRYPDESQPLKPGVPAALGGELEIDPIELAAEVWYPSLRPGLRDSLIKEAEAEAAEAEQHVVQSRAALEQAAAVLTNWRQSPDRAAEPELVLEDDFSAARPDVWKTLNGSWQYRDGRLVQSAVTSFATMVTEQEVSGDFRVHLRYRTLQPGSYRSVGFSFDFQDKGNSQDIYTSTGDKRQSVQAFHRVDGKQDYPQAGIVSTPLEIGREVSLDVAVTGSKLTIDLDGVRKLDYTMPVKRRDGKFALWVHQGAAEFLELKITRQAPSRETLQRRVREAESAVKVAEAESQLARGEWVSLTSRLAAEVGRYIERSDETARLAVEARAAELAANVLKAELEVLRAGESTDKLAAARKQLAEAKLAAEKPTGDYTPIGEQYPRVSTGRRAALARWITSAENPRTARVAVNYIWAHHFGRPLVATPENFGLNGRRPTHPQLLDWLASELISSGWRMKPLHKRLVLSATYRMASTPLAAAERIDPDNTLLWRASSRRMEAEVVRDSVLYLASQLDLRFGGPEIPETEGQSRHRRSLYFRNTPNEKMEMLEVFDVADPNACYRRKESIVPQQSLAMMNGGLTLDAARAIAEQLSHEADFVTAAFETILARRPTTAEADRCRAFLADHAMLLQRSPNERFPKGGTATRPPASQPEARARENLVHVLFLHNSFVTIR